MSMKARGIVTLVATLIVADSALAQLTEPHIGPSPTSSNQVELSTFVRGAIDANPQVNAALAAVEASIALEGAAGRPLYNPELEFEAANADSKTRAIGVSQALDWGGKRRARLTVAEAERRSMQAAYVSVRWQTSLDLLSALANYQTNSDRYTLASIRTTAMRDFAAISKRRFDAGDISQIDLDLAMLAHTQARMQKATSAASVAESKQAVVSLVSGALEDSWPRIEEDFPPAEVSSDDASDFLMDLPSVREAQLQAEAASARVSLRELERQSDPILTLRGGTEDDETLIGLSVTVPLRIRNSFRHEVTAASAGRRQAQQVLSDVSRRAYTRFLGAQERYQISLGAWQDWRDTGDVSLQSQGVLLRRLWEAGELSTTDYLVQLRQTLDTEESALDLRRSMWRAWFEWMTASGQIESWLGRGS